MNTQPTAAPLSSRPSGQGATVLLLGFMILLISVALILSVRVHARLDMLTQELVKLNARLGPESAKPQAAGGKGTVAAAGEKRSPIPQPGEEIVTPIPPTLLGEKTAPKAIAAEPVTGEVVPWDKAHLHMGRSITVAGKIVNTRKLATVCFLNFTTESGGGDKFYLVIFKDQFDEWGGAPEQYFLNKTVRVTGKVEDRNGRPQMKINKKEQVLSVNAE